MLLVVLKSIGSFFVTVYKILLGKEGKNAQVSAIIAVGFILATTLLCGIAVKSYFKPSELEQNIDNRAPVIQQNQSNINATQPQIETGRREVEKSRKTSQNATKEREKAVKTDSKEYANANSGQRFCERFPEDSTCK